MLLLTFLVERAPLLSGSSRDVRRNSCLRTTDSSHVVILLCKEDVIRCLVPKKSSQRFLCTSWWRRRTLDRQTCPLCALISQFLTVSPQTVVMFLSPCLFFYLTAAKLVFQRTWCAFFSGLSLVLLLFDSLWAVLGLTVCLTPDQIKESVVPRFPKSLIVQSLVSPLQPHDVNMRHKLHLQPGSEDNGDTWWSRWELQHRQQLQY